MFLLFVGPFESVANFQCGKKHSNELKRTHKWATTLEGEVRKKDKELATTTRELVVTNVELSKKQGEVQSLDG